MKNNLSLIRKNDYWFGASVRYQLSYQGIWNLIDQPKSHQSHQLHYHSSNVEMNPGSLPTTLDLPINIFLSNKSKVDLEAIALYGIMIISKL